MGLLTPLSRLLGRGLGRPTFAGADRALAAVSGATTSSAPSAGLSSALSAAFPSSAVSVSSPDRFGDSAGSGDSSGNGGLVGASVGSGDSSGNGGLVGASAGSGANSGNGGLAGAAIGSGPNSGNGGLVGVSAGSDGVRASVVSMPCWDLFEAQDEAYQESVLPPDAAILAVEAAASFGWDRWADDSVSIDRFGASAPGEVALAKLGYTPEHVAQRARELIDELEEG